MQKTVYLSHNNNFYFKNEVLIWFLKESKQGYLNLHTGIQL